MDYFLLLLVVVVRVLSAYQASADASVAGAGKGNKRLWPPPGNSGSSDKGIPLVSVLHCILEQYVLKVNSIRAKEPSSNSKV